MGDFMKFDDKTKAYVMGAVTVLVSILLFVVCLALVNSITNNKVIDNKKEPLYGTVSEISDDYIIVKPIDEEKKDSIKVETDDEYNIGDFILVEDDEVKVIASNDELKDVTTTIKPTTIVTVPKTSEASTKSSKVKTTTTTKKVSDSLSYKEEDVIAYVENLNNEVDNANSNMSFKEKFKEKFILVVDFIFYDGEIKGYKFDELTNTAKAKVVFYALKIDSKINDLWPNYKEIIGDKVNDLKAKLIAKYMDVSTTICSKYPEDCENVKNDFKILKSSLSVTWDVVKNAFKYGYGKTTDYLRTWYEVFSGK